MAVSVPSLRDYKHHAFLTHASENADLAREIVEKLETAGFSILIADRDFLAGNLILDEICRAVKQCRRVIMLMSEDYLKSSWCQYEINAALERTLVENKVASLPILYRMSKEQIPERLKWLNYLDYDHEYFWDRLYKSLSRDLVHVEAAMPVGNVASGLAWSYFYGYLNFLLKDHVIRMQASEWWDEDPTQRRMSQKLFILIPTSCLCYTTFHDADPAIDTLGHLETLLHTRAGVFERPYKTPVHKITDKDGQVCFFAGEYATPILSMYEMEEGEIAGLKAHHKEAEVNIFYHTLQNILNHAVARHCHDKFYIHLYKDCTPDGSRFPLAEEISNLVKGEIQKEVEQEKCGRIKRLSSKEQQPTPKE